MANVLLLMSASQPPQVLQQLKDQGHKVSILHVVNGAPNLNIPSGTEVDTVHDSTFKDNVTDPESLMIRDLKLMQHAITQAKKRRVDAIAFHAKKKGDPKQEAWLQSLAQLAQVAGKSLGFQVMPLV